MNALSRKTAKIMEQLIGSTLVSVMRAAQMPRFQFAQDAFDNANMHIHIQCAYRLAYCDEILLASSDIYQPNSQYDVNQSFDFETFDWDVFGNNRFDEIVQNKINPQLGNTAQDVFRISNVEVSDFGDVKISFNGGITLELFNDSSGEEESWRFFSTTDSSVFIVMTGAGIEI